MPDILISQFDRKFGQPIETFRRVNSLANRDSIPNGIRWEGMLVYVVSDQNTYQLTGGLDNSFWQNYGGYTDIFVVDNLESFLTTAALSANQGRELNDKFASYQLLSEKGAANGYAPLGADSKVPAANLPAYVDDVVEYANLAAFPATGETGKLYVALDTNFIYRWSGSTYIQIGGSGPGDYVLKSGDTMTGQLTIKPSVSSPLEIWGSGVVSNNSAQNFILAKDSAGSNMWYIGDGSGGSNDTIMYNYASAQGVFLLGTGGSSGLKYFESGESKTVWHSGNDGLGSGLDADLLDGLQSSQFLRSDTLDYKTSGDLVFNSDTYIAFRTGTTIRSKIAGSGVDTYWIMESGNIFIRDNGSNRFTLSRTTGNLTATGTMTATNFIQSSDKRLKKNIKRLKPVDLSHLKWSTFVWKENGDSQIGLIAQEVEKTNPEFVLTNKETGLKSVKNMDIIIARLAYLESIILK